MAEVGFALGAAAAASLATVVWGEASILAGVVSGVGALLIAAFIVWMLRTGTGSENSSVNPVPVPRRLTPSPVPVPSPP